MTDEIIITKVRSRLHNASIIKIDHHMRSNLRTHAAFVQVLADSHPMKFSRIGRHVVMIPSTASKRQHKLVKIVWKDAFAAPQGWTSMDDYETEPAQPVTVGWLLEDVLDGYVTTADTFLLQDGEITYYNVGHIPIEMILSMEILEQENKKGSKKRRSGAN